MKLRASLIMTLFFMSPLNAGEPDISGQLESAVQNKMKDTANRAFSYGDDLFETWARDNFSSLRLIEIETKVTDSAKPQMRLISLFEIFGDGYNAVLSQLSFSTFDDREIFNGGVVYRTFNNDKTLMYGTNLFYDQQLNTGHKRFSLGFELKSSVYDFNLNLYDASSSIHHVEAVPEVAAGGYDAEIGIVMPYLPWVKIYYKAYQWNNETLNIKNGENLSLYMEPTSRLSLEAGMNNNSTLSSKKTFVRLNYILCCADESTRPSMFNVSSKAFNYVPLEEKRMYEKVRRENNIIVVRGGGGISVTASGF